MLFVNKPSLRGWSTLVYWLLSLSVIRMKAHINGFHWGDSEIFWFRLLYGGSWQVVEVRSLHTIVTSFFCSYCRTSIHLRCLQATWYAKVCGLWSRNDFYRHLLEGALPDHRHKIGFQHSLSSRDRKIERVKLWLEGYFRCFVHGCLRKWSQWLPLAEFWYNIYKHPSLDKSPFWGCACPGTETLENWSLGHV